MAPPLRQATTACAVFLWLSCMCLPMAHGGNINRNSAYSAEYLATLNRNASTDPDAAFYNPAGIAFSKTTGLSLQLTNQSIFFSESFSGEGHDINSTHESWIAPTLAIVQSGPTWSGYVAFGVFGGAKKSGIGREGGEYSMEFYMELQNICLKV